MRHSSRLSGREARSACRSLTLAVPKGARALTGAPQEESRFRSARTLTVVPQEESRPIWQGVALPPLFFEKLSDGELPIGQKGGEGEGVVNPSGQYGSVG
jgi:hypothetical protein